MAEGRRTIMQWLLRGGFTASIVSFVYHALRFMNPPPVPEASVNEAPAGKVGDMKVNSAKIVKFGSRPALLMRVGENEFRAVSAVCTHLNCTVQYQDASRQVWCACHNAFYDTNGKVLSGPPPAPLEEFAVRMRGDEIVISKRA